MLIITLINWISNLLHGTNFDLSSLQASWDVITEAIGFIGYFIPLGPVVVCLTFVFATYAFRLLVSSINLLKYLIPFF